MNTGIWLTTKVFLLRRFYRFIGPRIWKGHNPKVAFNDLQADTSAGPLSLRIYNGEHGRDRPLIIYFHGGGWVLGDLESHHPYCQSLCQRSGCTVIAVDYRLAPEHPYPAAHDDCLAATHWIAAHSDETGASNGTIVLAGDSAGGNLATATCLALEQGVRQRVIGEVVIYPATDHYQRAFASYVTKARGFGLTSGMMRWFWDTYLGISDPTHQTEQAMPARATNLASLPPTLLVTAENDPLRDEGVEYADLLRKAGVTIQYQHFENAAHGFACSEGPTENFEAFMQILVKWLHKL